MAKTETEAPDFIKKPEQVIKWEKRGLKIFAAICLFPLAIMFGFMAFAALAMVEAVVIQMLLAVCVVLPVLFLGLFFKPVKLWYTALGLKFTSKWLYPIAPIEYLELLIKEKEDLLVEYDAKIEEIAAIRIDAEKRVADLTEQKTKAELDIQGLKEDNPDYERMAMRLALAYDRSSDLLEDATKRLLSVRKSERLFVDRRGSCELIIERLKSELETCKQKWAMSKAISGAAESARGLLSGLSAGDAQWAGIAEFIEHTDSVAQAKMESVQLEGSSAQIDHKIQQSSARARFDEIRRKLDAPASTGVRVAPDAGKPAAEEASNPFQRVKNATRSSGPGDVS